MDKSGGAVIDSTATLVLIQTLRAPGPRERSNYYSWLLRAVPMTGEDVDKKVDVDHEENKDVGLGKHKKTKHRQDVAVKLDVDQEEMSITGKDVAHRKDADQRKNKDQTTMGTAYTGKARTCGSQRGTRSTYKCLIISCHWLQGAELLLLQLLKARDLIQKDK